MKVYYYLMFIVFLFPVADAQKQANKKRKKTPIKKLDSRVIKEVHEGVTFFLRLPTPTVVDGKSIPQKPKGIIIELPAYNNVKASVHSSLGIGLPEKEKHLDAGYARLIWMTPAQPLKGDKNFDISYGVNTNDLSPEMKQLRDKRWNPWLPKIDAGIELLIEKYDLPENGYIATSWCISTDRLCRYIDYRPERFSSHFAFYPLGMNAINERTKHIYTMLVDQRTKVEKGVLPHDYKEGIRRFHYECHKVQAPCSVLMLNKMIEKKDIPIPLNNFVDYNVNVREKMKFSGTLTEDQILRMGNHFREGLADSNIAYDLVTQSYSDKSGENLISYPELQTKIPLAFSSILIGEEPSTMTLEKLLQSE